MQNTMSVPQLQVNKKAGSQSRTSKWQTGQEGEMTDPFMQIIMNLISQNPDSQATQEMLANPELSEIAGLFQAQQSVTESDLMQLFRIEQFSQILEAGQQIQADATDTTQTPPFTAVEGILTQTAMIAGENSGAILDMAAQTLRLDTEQSAEPTSLQAIQQATQPFAASQTTIMSDEIKQLQMDLDNGEAELKSGERRESTDTVRIEFGEGSQKAKQLGLQKPLQEDTEELDVDVLQSRVSRNTTDAPFELRFKSAAESLEAPLNEQISDGIKQNISLGKSEFILKLKPESLGEITLKLVEEAGKTSLTISTASSQTARLINSELNALKLAVAPMNVEVNDAVTQVEQTQQTNMQRFDMAQQQFAQQQQFSHEQFDGQRSYNRLMGTGKAGGEIINGLTEESYVAYAGAIPSKRLDAYV